jgi:hypothetical protein
MKLMNILKEIYGMTKLSADLESWAVKNGLNFKKVSSEKKPGQYGSSISNNFYQIGDKFALIRYETVTGAPRLNQLRFFVLDAPNTQAKVLSGINYVEDFSEIQQALEKVSLKGGAKTQKTWTKGEINSLIRDLVSDKRYNKFTDDQAFEMAQSILADQSGLEDAIKNAYGVTDAVGWLADRL